MALITINIDDSFDIWRSKNNSLSIVTGDWATIYPYNVLKNSAHTTLVDTLNDLEERKLDLWGETAQSIVGAVTVQGVFTANVASNLIGDVSVNTNKFNITAASGNTAIAGDVAVATNKFTVAAASGNTLVAGTLNVTGVTTLSNSLNVTGDVAVATNKFTIASATGNTLVAGILSVSGNVAVATNKFTVASSTGNTLVAGTFDVTGITTLASTLNVTGNVAVATNKFTVAASTGNTLVAGTFDATGVTTLASTLNVTGDVAIATNKFNVTAATGNTSIAGTLSVTGTQSANTIAGSAVGSTISLWDNVTTGSITAFNALTTGSITIDGSTNSHTLNLAAGATANTFTKTVNIATGGVTGSTTNITVGSSVSTTLNLNGATVNLPQVSSASPSVSVNTPSILGLSNNGVLGNSLVSKVLISGAGITVTESVRNIFISSNGSTPPVSSTLSTTTVGQNILVGALSTVATSTISGATYSAGVISFTTVAAHGLVLGASVIISGITPSGFNGTFVVASAVDTTHFTVTAADPGSAYSGGGSVYTSYRSVATTNVVEIRPGAATTLTNMIKITSDNAGATEVFSVSTTGKTIVKNLYGIDTNTVTYAAAGSANEIASFTTGTASSAEFLVQGAVGANMVLAKFICIHDGTTVSWSEYGRITAGTAIVNATSAFSIDISTGSVRLTANQTATNVVWKVVINSIK
jgi:hypothetical protein